jgi:hypothetical protein
VERGRVSSSNITGQETERKDCGEALSERVIADRRLLVLVQTQS